MTSIIKLVDPFPEMYHKQASQTTKALAAVLFIITGSSGQLFGAV